MTGARYHKLVAGLSDVDNKLKVYPIGVKQVVHKLPTVYKKWLLMRLLPIVLPSRRD